MLLYDVILFSFTGMVIVMVCYFKRRKIKWFLKTQSVYARNIRSFKFHEFNIADDAYKNTLMYT